MDRDKSSAAASTTSPYDSSDDLKSITAFLFVLVGAGVLLMSIWALPISGFHHMYIVGIFGWLFINGEDPDPNSVFYFAGREYVPTIGGLPINLVATVGIFWFIWRCSRRFPRVLPHRLL